MQTPKDLYDALVAFHKPDEAGKVDVKTLRFVLYARKSTTSDERQERAISDQKKDCLDTAKRLEIPYENITIVNLVETYDFEPVVSVDNFLAINKLSDISAAFKMVKSMKKKQSTKADFPRRKRRTWPTATKPSVYSSRTLS